MTISIMIKSN